MSYKHETTSSMNEYLHHNKLENLEIFLFLFPLHKEHVIIPFHQVIHKGIDAGSHNGAATFGASYGNERTRCAAY